MPKDPKSPRLPRCLAKKPFVERERRARINQSLDDLKVLVLQGLDIDTDQHPSLTKSEILNLTVHYIKTFQNKQRPCGTHTTTKHKDTASSNTIHHCFHDFAEHLRRRILHNPNVDMKVRSLMLNLLSQYITSEIPRQTGVLRENLSSPKVANYDLENAKSASLTEPVHVKREGPVRSSKVTKFWRPWSS